jgi:hypothetical protein
MQTPKPSPTPQVAPPAERPTFVIQDGTNGGSFTLSRPLSSREVAALKARRSELSDQLQSVDGRRSKLLSQLRSTGDQTAVQGLEERLALLDKRQLQLESDLAATGQQLSSASAGLAATAGLSSFNGLGSGQVVAISIVGMIFVLMPLAIGSMKILIRRSNRPALPPAAFAETAQRLERLESAVDTIAVEIERISEGQRFVTKLLSDGQARGLPAGQRSPETVPAGK